MDPRPRGRRQPLARIHRVTLIVSRSGRRIRVVVDGATEYDGRSVRRAFDVRKRFLLLMEKQHAR